MLLCVDNRSDAAKMGEMPETGFSTDDRKILNQLPVILQNINEKIDLAALRVGRLEDLKANRTELIDIERQIIGRLDGFRDCVMKIDKEKADKDELDKDEVVDHEKRLRVLEERTITLPEAIVEIGRLKDWKMKTIGYAAGASAVIGAVTVLMSIILRH